MRDKHCKMVGVEQFNKRRGIIGLRLNSLIYRLNGLKFCFLNDLIWFLDDRTLVVSTWDSSASSG